MTNLNSIILNTSINSCPNSYLRCTISWLIVLCSQARASCFTQKDRSFLLKWVGSFRWRNYELITSLNRMMTMCWQPSSTRTKPTPKSCYLINSGRYWVWRKSSIASLISGILNIYSITFQRWRTSSWNRKTNWCRAMRFWTRKLCT